MCHTLCLFLHNMCGVVNMCFQKCSFVFYCFLENKTWLDSVKNLAERIPDTASRLTSKNEKEHMPTSGGSGNTFVNYSELSNVGSGICTFVNKILRHSLRILLCWLWVCSSMALGIETWSHFVIVWFWKLYPPHRGLL